MAYKFQLGAAVLSGSLTQKGDVLAEASVLSGSSLSLAGTAITATAAELNILDGVTAEASELNILDGVTATTAELNLVDGSSAGTVVNSKAVIYGAAGEVVATSVSASGGVSGSVVVATSVLNGPSLTDDGTNPEFSAEVDLAAGFKIQGTTVTAGAADLNLLTNITSAVYAAASDLIVFSDADDSGNLKFESGADFVSAIAGAGIDQVSGQLAISNGNITSAMLAGSITADKLSLGNGLEDGAGGVLQIDLETANALSLTANGLDLKGTITGDRTFSNNVIITGDLTVNGTNTILNTQTLEVEDHVITISSGSNQATAVSNQAGIEFGSSGPTLKLNTDVDGSDADGFAFSLPVSASAFYGDGSGLTGVAATDARYSISLYPNSGSAYDMNGQPGLWLLNSGNGQAAVATEIHLSGTYANGDAVVVKAPANASTYNLTVKSVGSDTFETGGDTLTFESDSAALTLVYASSLNLWTIF
jgi:hypothetical protein